MASIASTPSPEAVCLRSHATPSFEEYEHHITLLDDHQYFLNKNMHNDALFDDKVDGLYVFMELYKKIEEEDHKRSAFYGSQKFKKGGGGGHGGHGGHGGGGPHSFHGGGPGAGAGYTYQLHFQRSKSKAWNSHLPKSTNEKLNTMIDTFFNKISDETYRVLSTEFIQELLSYEDVFFFDTISKKVMDKCVMDNKYQHLYIQLCSKIWGNRQIHYNLTTITHEEDGKYYWVEKNDQKGVRHGPFYSELDAKMNIFTTLNFKKYFIGYIQDLFMQKNVNFGHIESDEEFFLHKRQFMVLIEVIGILYMEKYIPIDILHIMIINLLHIHSVDSKIENIEIDGFLNLLKIMRAYAEKYSVTDYFQYPIYEEYYQYVCQLERCDFLNKRSKFFLIDCKDILKGRTTPSKSSVMGAGAGAGAEAGAEIDFMETFKEAVSEESLPKMRETYQRAPYEKKVAILYDIMYRMCENTSPLYQSRYMGFLRDLSSEEQAFRDVLKKGVESLDDLHIDIPEIATAMSDFVTMLEREHCIEEELKEETLEKIREVSAGWEDDEEEEDDNFF